MLFAAQAVDVMLLRSCCTIRAEFGVTAAVARLMEQSCYAGAMDEHRQVLVYPGEDGYWVVECPSLPGCVSQGRTRDEALHNIREAIDLYIESLREEGLPVPEDLFAAEVVAV